jgi:hypothetical protein
LALKLSGSRNRGDPTGISQPVEKLLDVDGTDIDERIFAIVWSRLLPDYQLIEAIEVDRRGALTAQCHAGIAAPVEFVVILLRLRASAWYVNWYVGDRRWYVGGVWYVGTLCIVKCRAAFGRTKPLGLAAIALAGLEIIPAMLTGAGLCILARGGIYIFDRAAKPIFFWSPVVLLVRGVSTFIRRVRMVGQFAEKPFGLKGGICAGWTT